MEDKKQMNAIKLMGRFSDVKILESKQYEFSVYTLEKDNNHGFSSPSMRIAYPSPFNTGNEYFVAEVMVKMSPRGGFALYKHAFQLDMASVKIELEKINIEYSKNITSSPRGIASILDTFYYEFSEYLVDYNGVKDNYAEIAKLLVKCHGTAKGDKFKI
jgi:hypothetical protein